MRSIAISCTRNLLTIHHYRLAAWLKVSGPDAADFLQGQFTNDLRPLVPGGAVYGLWLDQKGKTLADSFVVAGPAARQFWIASYFSAAEVIQRRLEDYIIADDVAVENLTSAWAALTLVGEGVDAWSRAESALGGVFFPGRRGSLPSMEWIYPLAVAEAVALRIAGLEACDEIGMERCRIVAGIPAVPKDVGPGDLPNEGGLDTTAISFSKGCYLGQEIMARLKSRGRVRRRLTRVFGEGPPPAVPALLWQAERPVGELRSAVGDGSGAGFVGLAMLNPARHRTDLPLAAAAEGGTPIQISK